MENYKSHAQFNFAIAVIVGTINLVKYKRTQKFEIK